MLLCSGDKSAAALQLAVGCSGRTLQLGLKAEVNQRRPARLQPFDHLHLEFSGAAEAGQLVVTILFLKAGDRVGVREKELAKWFGF